MDKNKSNEQGERIKELERPEEEKSEVPKGTAASILKGLWGALSPTLLGA